MNELCLPLNERASLGTENFPIPDQPYIPTGQNNDFHKERLSKTSPGLIQHYLHIIITLPINLKIVPYSRAKGTLKKQVYPVLKISPRAQHTMLIFSHFPMSPLQQISCVQSV
jgi:hypothetical protein